MKEKFPEEARQEIEKYCGDPAKAVIVNLAIRKGTRLFIVRLEHEHFAPRSGKNHMFEMMITHWNEMPFILIRFPLEYLDTARKVAEECGLHFTQGIPIMLGGNNNNIKIFDDIDAEAFPGEGPNVWCTEGQYEGEDENKLSQAILDADLENLRGDYEKMAVFKEGKIEELEKWCEEEAAQGTCSPTQALLLHPKFCPSQFVFVGYMQDDPFACFGIMPMNEKECIMTSFYVHRVARKWGWGNKLLRQGIKWAIEKGFEKINVSFGSEVMRYMINKLEPEYKDHLVIDDRTHEKDLTKEEDEYTKQHTL